MKNSKTQFAALLFSTICLLTGAYGQITGVTAGTDLTGGGTSGNVTLNLNTATVPQLATANTFTGNQTVNGNLSTTGSVSALSFQIFGTPFAFGSVGNGSVFLGFSGNSTSTGVVDTGTGYQALVSNGSGEYNTAIGGQALLTNTSGGDNTAIGVAALSTVTTGNENTGLGAVAGVTGDVSNLTGSYNTAVGFNARLKTGTLNNSAAIGANAYVTESNAMVLGSINGVNGATASTNVGIGTTAPGHLLDVAGATAVDSTGMNNGTNFIDLTFGLNAGEGVSSSRTAGLNQYGIDIFTDFARRISIEQHGNVGIGTTSPDSLLTVNGSADKPGGGSWGTFSDGRLKNLNGSYSSGLSQILRINPIRYRYKADNAMGIRDTDEHIGVVAQEVQQVIPEAVTENSKGYLLVNNDPIIWSMLNAIKEQQEEIRALKSELRSTRQSLQKVQAQVARTQPALVAAK
ncbi:MAG: tail fiber domain-containing protein [Terriglobales bacterium]